MTCLIPVAIVVILFDFNLLLTSVQVIDELLSLTEDLGKDTAKGIADAAMREVASTSMAHMVCEIQFRLN